jgi:hypothetical protein
MSVSGRYGKSGGERERRSAPGTTRTRVRTRVDGPLEPLTEREQPVALTRRSSEAAARPHVGDPPATNSVSREPQLPQRQRSRTSGTSLRPTVIRSARSASQRGGTLCTRHVLSRPYGLPSGVSGGVRVCPVPRHQRPTMSVGLRTRRRFDLAHHHDRSSAGPGLLERYGPRHGLVLSVPSQ